MRPSFLVALLCVLHTSLLIPQAGADTVLHYTSDPGNSIGHGTEGTFDALTGYDILLNRGFADSLSFQVQSSQDQMFAAALEIGGPFFTPLAVGAYAHAIQQGSETQPRLGFDTSVGYGYDETSGKFQVLEITYDAYGNVATFAADFVLHPTGIVSSANTYGQIRYNSNIPYLTPGGLAQFGADQYSVLENAGSLSVAVSRTGGGSGALSVAYATSDGTDLAGRDYTAVSGTLSWADGDTADKTISVPILNSGNPAQGDGTFQLNLTGAGVGLQSQTTVTVVNDNSAITYVHFIIDPDPITHQSLERTFSLDTGYVISATQSVGLIGPATYEGSVAFSFDNRQAAGSGNLQSWTLDLSAPQATSLGVGDYEDAHEYPLDPSDGSYPGLTLSGDGGRPDTITGNFQVLEAAYDAAGNVVRFAANFVQYNDGSAQAIRGEVRYNSTLSAPVLIPMVSVVTQTPIIEEVDGTPGVFTILRTGNTSQPLTVNYQMKGSAVNGQDYQSLSGTKVIQAGKSSARVKVLPINPMTGSGDALSVKLKIKPPSDGSYIVGSGSKTVVYIDQND